MSDAADTTVLRARGLRKEYGKGEGLVRAVDGVDLDIGAGETVAVMGPAAAGSPRCCTCSAAGPALGREVSLNGRRIDNIGETALARMRRTDVGFVFQAFHLMEELTAVENVELSALLTDARRGRPDGARSCWSRSGSPTGRGSTGAVRRPAAAGRDRPGVEQRTVGRSRRRAHRKWDSAATLDVLQLLESLHESGQTLVIVTHDARIAATADRMISMRDGAFVDETRLTGGTTGQLGAPRAGGLRAMGRICSWAASPCVTSGASAALLLLAIGGHHHADARARPARRRKRCRSTGRRPTDPTSSPASPARRAFRPRRASAPVDHSGPYPLFGGTSGIRSNVECAGRGATPRPSVDQPELIQGAGSSRWRGRGRLRRARCARR